MRKKRRTKTNRLRRKRRNLILRWLFAVVLLAVTCFIVYTYSVEERLYPRQYRLQVEKYAAENDLDDCLVYSLIKAESNFQVDAVSSKGAVGLMQLMPETARWSASKMEIAYEESRLTECDYNIKIGTWYLKRLLNYYENDINKAIAAYNGGEGNVDAWLKDGIWKGTLKDADAIPFPETREYLKKVIAYYEKYRAIYE